MVPEGLLEDIPWFSLFMVQSRRKPGVKPWYIILLDHKIVNKIPYISCPSKVPVSNNFIHTYTSIMILSLCVHVHVCMYDMVHVHVHRIKVATISHTSSVRVH